MRIRLFALLMGFLLMTTQRALAGDWPSVDQLPAQKGFPDPLMTLAGERITSAEQWHAIRRPELRRIFQHYMYGDLPKVPTRITATILHEDRQALSGKATLREVKITLATDCPPIYLLLVVPNDREGPVPAFVGMNFCGNHALVADPKIRIPDVWLYPSRKGVVKNRATEQGRGAEVDTWVLDQTIARGYAVATFYNGDVDPDQNDKREGMRPFLSNIGVNTTTIMAWAWGIMRVMDYLETVNEIDRRRVAVVGHSRLGKTALVAAAFDDRFALAIPHQAGTGGSAPNRSRNPKSESVQRINTSFPHWFNAEFKTFNTQVEKLPFDQHCLVALVAPRPVLFTNAVEDQWANPDGQFDILKSAEPVYRLLGASGLEATSPPAVGTLVGESLGYYIRDGKHSMTRDDWKVFCDFADKHLRTK